MAGATSMETNHDDMGEVHGPAIGNEQWRFRLAVS